MDLTLTRRADYVVRAAIFLAKAYAGGGYKKNRELAAEMGVPLRYAPHIFQLLTKAGLAEAQSGRKGGYRLAREPEQVSLLEVVEAGEGGLKLERCTLQGGPCHWQTMCPLHPSWEAAARAMKQALRQATLGFVAQLDWSLESGTYTGGPAPHRVQIRRDRSEQPPGTGPRKSRANPTYTQQTE